MANPASGQPGKHRCLLPPTRKPGAATGINPMEHVFLLLVYLGVGDSRNLVSNDMYFRSIVECNFFAAEIARRYGTYSSLDAIDPRDRTTVYCIPKLINTENVEVY